jgi:signal transduction histidine kinase
MTTPLFFKDTSFFSSIGVFAYNFTTPVALLFLSIIVLRINSGRFEALEQNIHLKQELLQAEKINSVKIENELIAARRKITEDAANLALARVATQVSHDIRSPLASLQAVIHGSEGMDEQSKVLVRTSVNRIRDIANNLLAQHREAQSTRPPDRIERTDSRFFRSSEPASVVLLAPHIESCVSEKRAQYGVYPKIKIDSDIPPEFSGVFAEIQPIELGRVLSNLINNSVEALGRSGEVNISLSAADNLAFLSVRDNGEGIPPDLLQKVIEPGGTFGKADGNGLGLSHAIATAKTWGGALKIESEVGTGTAVILEIPLATPPSWFSSQITLGPNYTTVIVDDDPSVEQTWRKRFRDLKLSNTVVHLRSPQALLEWYRDHPLTGKVLFLCDYEFSGSKQTGLDLIEMTGIGPQAILVTNRWDDESVRYRSEKIGLKILPKSMAGTVAISVSETAPP